MSHRLVALTAGLASILVSAAPAFSAQKPKEQAVDEIVVRPTRRAVAVDRRSYDIDARGTVTARDAVERLPGVVVEIDGQVSILGQTTIIYQVDGRFFPTELALQIPASQIERVEIVTNPGADSQGDGVIVNLILRKAYSGRRAITATLRADTRERYLGRLDFEQEDDSWSRRASASVEADTLRRDETADFRYAFGDQAGDTARREVAFDRDEVKAKVSASLERKLAGTRSVSFGVNANTDRSVARDARSFVRRRGKTPVLDRREDSETATVFASYGLTGTYVLEAAADATTTFNVNLGRFAVDIEQRDLFDANGVVGGFSRDTDQTGTYAVLSGAAERKDEAGHELNFGVDARWFDETERYAATNDPIAAGLSPDGAFAHQRTSAAAYASYGFDLGALSVLPGLRAEVLEADIDTLEGGRTEGPSYARLLPSLHLARRIGGIGTLKASATVKTITPRMAAFDPVRRRIAFDTFRTGDEDLEVGLARNFEASFETAWDRKTLLATFYHRERDDRADLFTDLLGNDEFLLRYVNVDDVRTGANVNFGQKIGERFEQTIDASVFRLAQDWSVDGVPFASDQASYTVKYNGEFRRTKRETFLLIVQQQGRGLDLNLDSSPRLSSTIRFVRTFENGAALTIEGIDFLATNTRTRLFESDDFVRSDAITRQERGVRLTLSRRF